MEAYADCHSLWPATLDARNSVPQTGRFVTHYQTLGVQPDAKFDAIRGAYRALVGKHHPDKGGDPVIFHAVQEAYEVVGDEARRRAYDAAAKNKPVESLTATASRMVDEFFAEC